MKRVAYAAANSLTVAGLDFPCHIWSTFFPLFFCLRSLNVWARQVYSSTKVSNTRAAALANVKLLKWQQLRDVLTVVGAVSALARKL